ncbi:MAG: hypothetical protein ACK4QW_03370 [Alphaproteobacteria bacterium]
MYLQFEDGGDAVFAGRFNAGFGRAWDDAPGIYGADFAADYEFNEKLGLGGAVKVDGRLGRHALGLKLYTADHTGLSRGLLERRFEDRSGRPRWRNRESYPGSGNTAAPQSIVASASGEDIGGVDGLTYTLGLIYETGDDGAADQRGGLIGFGYSWETGEGLTVTLLTEFAALDRYLGGQENRRYATGGVELAFGGWTGSLSGTLRHIDPLGRTAGPDTTDLLGQATAGYTFANGIGLHLGWKIERIDNVRYETAGALVRYRYSLD